MAEYISRERAIEILKASWEFDRANGRTDWRFDEGRRRSIEDIKQAPAEDVKPVVHGTWIMRGGKRYCSVCGDRACVTRDTDDFWYTVGTKFCPSCGAMMEDRKL